MVDYNRRFNDNDPCWLVKVDTHISGPFSFNEIIAKLTSGTLSPHHEVIAPMERWKSLQSQPLFVAAIEKMRRTQEETHEQTMTRTEKSMFNKTLDITVDKQTPTPMNETITPPPLTATPASIPRYVSDGPRVIPTPEAQTIFNSNRFFLFLIGSLALVVLIVLGLYFGSASSKTQAVVSEKKSDFVEYFDRGLEKKKIGDWSEALKNFKLAHQHNNKDVDLILEMSPLLVQIDGQTMYSRSLIEKIIASQYKKEYIAVGRNIIGLSYAYEAQNSPSLQALAAKNFEEGISNGEDEEFAPSLINLGSTYMMSGKYSLAEPLFIKATKQNSVATLAYVYLVENYLLEGFKLNNKKSFEKAYQLTNQLIYRKQYDASQELLLFHAYAAFKLGQSNNSVSQLLQNSLMIDPDLTADHLHSPLLDWRGLQWKNFSFICADLNKIAQYDLQSLLNFVCSYKTQGATLATQESVDGWMSRNQKSSQAHVARAVLVYSLGELEKAKDSLGLAEKLGAQDKLYFQVRSKVCAALKDKACVKDLNHVLARFSPLHNYTALAIFGDHSSLLNGLRESPQYIPLLRLQNR